MSTFLVDYYDNKHQSGIAMIINNDTIPLFGGVNEKMKEDLVVANLIDIKDLRWNQMLSQFNQLERLGLCFSLAGRDFPSHVTIKVTERGLESRDELLESLIIVDTLFFNRFVLDASGNIFLASEIVPRLITKWRQLADEIMKKYGGKPKPLPILHSTFARFTQAESITNDERKYLVRFVDFWNLEFKKTPLNTHTESIFVGTSYDLLRLTK